MMNDSELKRFIKQEISNQVRVILSGQSGGSATVEDETIDNMLPGSPSIPKRPVMHPFGFASRAVKKVISVVARQGDGPTNRLVLGHRHSGRPADLKEGESTMYAWDETKLAYQIRAALDGIYVMSPGGKKLGLLIGDDTIAVLVKLLDAIIAHTHGPPGTPPSNAADFTAIKTNDLAKKTLISTKEGGFT